MRFCLIHSSVHQWPCLWIVGFRLAENVVADLPLEVGLRGQPLSFVAENFVGSTLQIRFDQVAQEPR
jgi:hypothetical protein